MMHSFSLIEDYYTQGDIYERIISLLQRSGIDISNVTRKDIAGIDEFHIRGQAITRELAEAAELQQGMRVLDVGCGIGGPCRYLADEYGCMATGIDITASYIETAKKLSQLTGLQQGTQFVQGSATDLPFPSNSFDVVWTQHVQMNIAGKQLFYSEMTRVLATSGRLAYYDVFSTGSDPVYYPVPWAHNTSLSHLITTGELKKILSGLGLKQQSITDQTAKSIAFYEKLFDRVRKEGPAALGTHLMMGETALEKLQNLLRNLSEKKIVVESGIWKKDEAPITQIKYQ